MNDLILEYIANRTEEGDYIANLGDLEIQTGNSDGNIPTNKIFKGDDRLINAIRHIIMMYYEDELKDWESCNKPNNHILEDLETLKTLL